VGGLDCEKRIVRTLSRFGGRHTDPVQLREDALAVLRDAGAEVDGEDTSGTGE